MGPTGLLVGGAAGQTARHDGTTWVSASNLYNDGTNIGVGTTTPMGALTVLAPTGRGVHGEVSAASGVHYGVYGKTSSATGFGVYADGDLGATGTKSFIQPHPTDASREIRFVCLEGNEAGTYFRGSAALVGGIAVIDVPEEFRLVTSDVGVTVQVTPRGPGGGLWVDSVDLNRVVVRGAVDVGFDYFVNGVRLGYEDFQTLLANTAYVPRFRGVPYGTQYPQAIRDLLVQSGILDPDYTPNEVKAAEMGWVLMDPEPESDSRAPRTRTPVNVAVTND